MYLIAGLGNPGKKYTYTRHNVGFMAISDLQSELNIPNNSVKEQCKGLVASTFINGEKVLVCEPLTFMNLSGDCIACLQRYYKIPTENIIIIYDDIDIPLGEIRIRAKGGPGTHNGMKSIVYSLDSRDFPRIRVGTGPVPENQDLINFVLTPFTKSEMPVAEKMAEVASEAAVDIIKNGVEAAMNKYNKYKYEN